MADTLRIPLKYPFTNAAGEHIESLPITRLKRRDLKAADKYSKDAGDQEDFLFAKMTGLTVEDIEALDVADSKAVTDAFREMVGD